MREASRSKDVTPAFVEAYEAIRALMAPSTRGHIWTRHRIGTLLCKVKDEPKEYGEHAVERLAKKLRVGAPTLYRYATVAEAWSLSELEALMARAKGQGTPLSWSHFVALARIADAPQFMELLDHCLAQTWPVRELTRHVEAHLEELARSRSTGGADLQVARAALVDGVESASTVAVRLGFLRETLTSRLLDAGCDPELLARAIDVYEELRENVELLLECLRPEQACSPSGLRLAGGAHVGAATASEGRPNDEPSTAASAPELLVTGAA